MRQGDLILIATAARKLNDGSARKIRESAGLSQAQVGAACNVTAAAVSRWELRERLPRTKAAIAYARLLERLTHTTRAEAA